MTSDVTFLVSRSQCVSDAITNQEWADAMKAEIDSLHDNRVWDLVQLPEGRKAVGSKWVFKVKTNADGYVERCKACLVAQGYSEKEGLDYDKTFSPVVPSESVHSVITLASKNGLKLHHMDITTTILNGNLKEEVYMKQPDGFLAIGQEHLVCRLRKCIYGLKQSPRCWNQALDAQLKLMGFKQNTSDPCIYLHNRIRYSPYFGCVCRRHSLGREVSAEDCTSQGRSQKTISTQGYG